MHGVLHLLGFDHEAEADAEQMEALERDVLSRLGIADPYETAGLGRGGSPWLMPLSRARRRKTAAMPRDRCGACATGSDSYGGRATARACASRSRRSSANARRIAEPIDPQERMLIGNILKLHELSASDVMVQRVDILALDVETPFPDVVKLFVEQGHSRVPVYRETLDDVIGFVHIKDVLAPLVTGRPVQLAKLVRKALVVAPSMPLLDLLLQMRLSRIHMAMVVDEFGGIDGLVTIEDVIEEIVGEIEDEHDDAAEPQLILRPDGAVIADARTPIAEFEERFKVQLVTPGAEEEVDSLGGLVFTLAGRVPSRGEIIEHPSGIEFEVLDADPRRVKRLGTWAAARDPAGDAAGPACLTCRSASASRRPRRSGRPQRFASWLGELAGWRRYLVAFLLGALAAAALPPVDVVPCCSCRSAASSGSPADAGGRAKPSCSAGASASASSSPGSTGSPYRSSPTSPPFGGRCPSPSAGFRRSLRSIQDWRCSPTTGSHRAAPRARSYSPALWTIAEWLRGHLFTGLPWNLDRLCLVGRLSRRDGGASDGGDDRDLRAQPAHRDRRRASGIARRSADRHDTGAAHRAGGCGRCSSSPCSAAAGWCASRDRAAAIVPNVVLRLVQPVIPQSLKWDPKVRESNFQRLLSLSASPGADRVTDIIWPEAAATYFLDRDSPHREAIAALAPHDGLVITGTLRTDPAPEQPRHVWNSLIAINGNAEIVAVYDKVHLVPFGEYMPLSSILPLKKLTAGSVDLSAGAEVRTIALPGLPSAGPLICYEVIFPGDVVEPGHRPAWLLNVTNDAWFGFSSGPFQHFAIARTRAVEEGLPLVRAANNGISGVIDPYGRVVRRLGTRRNRGSRFGIADRASADTLFATRRHAVARASGPLSASGAGKHTDATPKLL